MIVESGPYSPEGCNYNLKNNIVKPQLYHLYIYSYNLWHKKEEATNGKNIRSYRRQQIC